MADSFPGVEGFNPRRFRRRAPSSTKVSNMRSKRGDLDQLSLWEGDVAPGATRPRRAVAHRALGPAMVVTGSQFASHGWPDGTVLHHQRASSVSRGDLAVVQDGDEVLVGFWGLDVGRPALFTDHGSIWLGERAVVVGVVTAVEAPLALE